MKPTLTIFSGVNGAGKSSLYKYFNEIGLNDFGTRINADEILRENGGDWKNDADNLRSGVTAVRRIYKCLENKESFNWETTVLNGFSLKILRMAKEKGYNVNFYFVGVENAKLAIERVTIRQIRGGHGIPEELIKKRYAAQYDFFSEAAQYIDKALFFDNSSTFKIVGSYSDKELKYIDENVIWTKNLTFCFNDKTNEGEIVK